MDDTDARIASTPLRGAPLAHFLAQLPPIELLPAVAALPHAAVLSLMPFVPAECDCKLVILPCRAHPGEPCDCITRALPCEHEIAAHERDWPLPGDAVAFLLWRLHPETYCPPRLLGRPSRNTNPRAQVAVYARRVQRKRPVAIWHPHDWIHFHLEALDDRITRPLRRLRNGADATGDLTLEGPGDGRTAAA